VLFKFVLSSNSQSGVPSAAAGAFEQLIASIKFESSEKKPCVDGVDPIAELMW